MKKIIKNSVQITGLTIAAMPLSYVVRLVLSKNLSLEEFGLFYALLGFFSILQSINDLGFSEAQLYFIPKFLENDRIDKVKATIKAQFINQIFTTLLISLILFISASWISETVFHSSEITNVFKLFIFYFITSDFLKNVRMLFFSYQEAKFYGTQEPIRIMLTCFLLILAVFLFKFDLLLVSLIWAIVYLFLAISYLFLFLKNHWSIFKAKHYSVKAIYKEFIPFLIPTLISNNMGTLFSSGTETLLLLIKGTRDVGLYNIAKPILNLAMALITPVSDILKPYVSQISENKDDKRIKTIILTILNLGVFVLFPFSLILMHYSKESIIFLFGIKFSEAYIALKFLSFEILFNVMNSFIYGLVFGLGLQKKRAKIIYYSSILSLVLSLLLIPRFGSVGVALSNLSYSIVAMIGGVIIIRKKIHFEIPIRNYFKIIFLGFLLILSQVLLKGISPINSSAQLIAFFFKISIGMMIYFYLGIFVFKIVNLNIFLDFIRPYSLRILNKRFLKKLI